MLYGAQESTHMPTRVPLLQRTSAQRAKRPVGAAHPPRREPCVPGVYSGRSIYGARMVYGGTCIYPLLNSLLKAIVAGGPALV